MNLSGKEYGKHCREMFVIKPLNRTTVRLRVLIMHLQFFWFVNCNYSHHPGSKTDCPSGRFAADKRRFHMKVLAHSWVSFCEKKSNRALDIRRTDCGFCFFISFCWESEARRRIPVSSMAKNYFKWIFYQLHLNGDSFLHSMVRYKQPMKSDFLVPVYSLAIPPKIFFFKCLSLASTHKPRLYQDLRRFVTVHCLIDFSTAHLTSSYFAFDLAKN